FGRRLLELVVGGQPSRHRSCGRRAAAASHDEAAVTTAAPAGAPRSLPYHPTPEQIAAPREPAPRGREACVADAPGPVMTTPEARDNSRTSQASCRIALAR